MDDLIPLINRLQDAFAPLGIPPVDLPEIAVVGSQSSGKSSVLESFVGKPILPRGAGICTRRPLVMQLTNIPASEQERAEFRHKPGQVFTDFDEVRKEIEQETERVAGGKKVSPEPIILRIFSPHVVNLTVVDLPGLTKIAVGDQQSDIVEIISAMVKEYISRPNCLILAVTPANQDIANSDGLQFARAVDPSGERTIGVLTKLDLMDAGTNCLEVLQGKVYPLRLGYIGVVLRSQLDIEKKKSIVDSLANEKKFFEMHSEYRSVASRMGIGYLSKTLNTTLENHIRVCLPGITRKIKDRLNQAASELDELGEIVETEKEKRATLLKCLNSFQSSFEDALEGRGIYVTESDLIGAARIRNIFMGKFRDSLYALDSCGNLTDDDIIRVRKNVLGTKADLFVPNSAFEVLLQDLILSLEAPSLVCVRDTMEEIREIITMVLCATKDLRQFESLQSRIQDVCSGFLSQRSEVTLEFVSNLVKMEAAFINTEHPNFESVRSGVYKLMIAKESQSVSDPPLSTVSVPVPVPVSAAASPSTPAKEGRIEYWHNNKWVKDCQLKLESGSLEFYSSSAKSADRTLLKKIPQLSLCTFREASRPNGIEIDLPRSGWLMSKDSVIFGLGSADEYSEWKTAILAAMGQQKPPSANRQSISRVPSSSLSTSPIRTGQPSARELSETTILRQLLTSYFDIVRHNVMDSVPKAVMLQLVNALRQGLHQELMTRIYMDEEGYAPLIVQSDSVMQQRRQISAEVEALRAALDIITKAQHRK